MTELSDATPELNPEPKAESPPAESLIELFDDVAPTAPVIHDPWLLSAIPKDGWLERNGFAPALAALIVGILAFLIFQIVGGVMLVVLVGARIGATEFTAIIQSGADATMLLMENHADLMLVGNTIGQFTGMGFFVFLMAKLHVKGRFTWHFLRFSKPDPVFLGLGAIGLVVLWPSVLFLGLANQAIPLPQSIIDFEESMRAVLTFIPTVPLWIGILAIGVTPALCEEIFFRGYIQRNIQRSFGVTASIVAVGFVFGAYHLSLSQVLPLSALGIYMGYLTWRTGTIWPAVLVHFLNNGSQVMLMHTDFGEQMNSVDDPSLLSVLPIAIVGLSLYYLINKAITNRAEIRLVEIASLKDD